MRWNRLSVKLMGAVGAASLLTIGVFAWISIETLRKQTIDEVIRSASQFSDTVKRSTHHAMLQNRWEDAHYIMDTIGGQEGVSRVRIFNKEGLILFSTLRDEVGRIVDKRAESCYACHAAEKPLERLMLPERARIVSTGEGEERILGMITPLYNEPSCSQAACHAHAPDKRILGVLDIGLSLAQVDAGVAAMRRKMALFATGLTVLILGILFILLQRSVIRPVGELLERTERVARGDLDNGLPVKTGDEIGALAESFNQMTSALKRAREELASLVETLEDRVRDRTKELQVAHAQLIQSEKMASLGKLAASIAHEINNPLSGVLTYVKLLSRRLKGRPPEQATLDTALKSLALAERETERCISIVRNLLDFARQRKPTFKEVDLNEVIHESLPLVSNRMGIQGIALEKNLGEISPVLADFGQFRQAFVNIILNACQAMEEGGALKVSSRNAPDGGMVEVVFKDTGVGIPPDHLSTIFDPFFTTKEKGTGLGLSVVYGIVNRHGGSVGIESQVGTGTSVTVRVPVARKME
jgi:two-component system NtrC family sensor kinase